MRKQGVWKSKSLRKLLEKTLDRNINEDQNQFPKTLFFFDFSNPLKQIKINLCSSKTLENLVLKHLERKKFLLFKFLMKTAQGMGIYNPF